MLINFNAPCEDHQNDATKIKQYDYNLSIAANSHSVVFILTSFLASIDKLCQTRCPAIRKPLPPAAIILVNQIHDFRCRRAHKRSESFTSCDCNFFDLEDIDIHLSSLGKLIQHFWGSHHDPPGERVTRRPIDHAHDIVVIVVQNIAVVDVRMMERKWTLVQLSNSGMRKWGIDCQHSKANATQSSSRGIWFFVST